MAEQTAEVQPGESKVVSFEAIPHEAKTYQVSVDGLTGSFKAVEAPPVFDPWSYDLNGDGYIDNAEAAKAASDYFIGKITKDQVNQVYALPAPPPVCIIGKTKCVGYDLHECQQAKRETRWVLVEKNSTRCGYVPPACATKEEKNKAAADYFAGIITKEEAEAILSLPTCP